MLKAIPTVESSFFNYFGTLAQQDDNTDLDDRDLGWAWDAIQFRAAARFLSGTSVPFTPVRIGVIDTGCDRTHREFQGVTFAPVHARKKSV